MTRVFFGPYYITVTKEDGLDWPWVKPDIYQVIQSYYNEKKPIFTSDPVYHLNMDTRIYETDSEAVKMIKEIIDQRVRPFV